MHRDRAAVLQDSVGQESLVPFQQARLSQRSGKLHGGALSPQRNSGKTAHGDAFSHVFGKINHVI
jgi:hypothetical protein